MAVRIDSFRESRKKKNPSVFIERGINELLHVKCLDQFLASSKHSISESCFHFYYLHEHLQ